MATTTSVSSTFGALDVGSLVTQLMEVERKPIEKLASKVSSYQDKISSFGTLKSLISSFQSAVRNLSTSLASYRATPSDTSVLSAVASSSAVAGTYSVQVTTLAQAHKLAAAGQLSDTTAIATGASTATFTVGTTSTDIAIAAGATLQDIRSAINTANIGITATIVNDGSGTPYRLALSSDNAGLDNAINSITVKIGGDTAVNDLLAYNPTENVPTPVVPMTETIPAANAVFSVNGIQITKSSNTVTDAIQGVTLNLSKESASATLKVERDTGAVSAAASEFVDAYNAMTSKLKSLSAYGSASSAAPSLAGDGTVRLMQDQLRDIYLTPATGGTLTTLSQVGISTQADGTLKLDGSTLDSAMALDFADVSNLFSSASGYATRMDDWTATVVGYGGLIDTHTDGLNTSIDGYQEQIDKLEARMTVLQKQFTTTYSNLNLLLSSMNSTSAYLTQQFSSSSK